ncbi:hypothetical protein CSOJ01_00574 [Colletotrichum sojae]|uniref:Uncharacterized protein n=1 Tax=Colletotrichum sojae TaxID=2175907 RepID=A0A8H6N5Y9_9PEZI|nr:hypothetical protein CSOJ01_00574 [Colletotrichum sojae]
MRPLSKISEPQAQGYSANSTGNQRLHHAAPAKIGIGMGSGRQQTADNRIHGRGTDLPSQRPNISQIDSATRTRPLPRRQKPGPARLLDWLPLTQTAAGKSEGQIRILQKRKKNQRNRDRQEPPPSRATTVRHLEGLFSSYGTREILSESPESQHLLPRTGSRIYKSSTHLGASAGSKSPPIHAHTVKSPQRLLQRTPHPGNGVEPTPSARAHGIRGETRARPRPLHLRCSKHSTWKVNQTWSCLVWRLSPSPPCSMPRPLEPVKLGAQIPGTDPLSLKSQQSLVGIIANLSVSHLPSSVRIPVYSRTGSSLRPHVAPDRGSFQNRGCEAQF